ncbi:hypothetical protein AAGC94_02470 [Clostridium sporogenes]|uniref:Uncharacterized protein n=2 Tax=Clostridium TaxID=1485 RepID=A0A7X5PCZ7_CLOSG|nr:MULTISPECIES: hypothetical protein [Clostridium]AJD30737.1 hypothetical protein T258_4 [Clostridium botulinum Prevot_594]AVP59640.1 hypothetical protein C7M79_02545 [Clostridium botulinum]AKC61953.1 hypothetical protein CLSPO_c12330 [Clostridium sporogenes]AKJ89253.1 hypothetical protein CLSPOx_06230 [Clostridium sporogenes]AVP63624.1 hypothetical protein C3B64_04835 [Clostridium botulinum]
MSKYEFDINDIKNIQVGDLPSAKIGIIDSLSGKDKHKNAIEQDKMDSYIAGHELGTEIENLLKGDQRDY